MKVGRNTIISLKASFYNHDDMEIGENTRIDDFCVLTGNIKIGSHVHIGCHNIVLGGRGRSGVVFEDFSHLAPGCRLISESDDHSGNSLVGPNIPDHWKPGLKSGIITLKRHVVLGTNTIVFPGITVGEGAVTGAFTLVTKDLEPWTIYIGIPAKRMKDRSKKMLEMEKEFLDWYAKGDF